ncbi:GNAT family N-acetyltransferase [Nocardia sp. XZ_19_385]|uniref:GNAT family N-acetyltransferase n=1 Tax=Nocardia sp. XZ_19_385 TaxID=2769488 RepID=UPI0018902CE4|nr:GNAT family N-acetyltransferase [Nocardia sp. XZ_19_385]
MTITIRPTQPLQHDADGATSRAYDVCVNRRRVGLIRIATMPRYGPGVGTIRALRIDEAERRKGRGAIAVLAAEEVLQEWGCTQVTVTVPADAAAGLRLSTALGYRERSRNMVKQLPAEPPALPAGAAARPMTEAEFVPWQRAELAEYTQDWIDRGLTPEQARAKAEADDRDNLPEGLATPDTWFRVLEYEGTVVGHVWVARSNETRAFVYDVKVAAEHRGSGHGRSLMLLAEWVALTAGATTLGLHVFAGNTPALRLYESLGYEVTQYSRYKPLV